MSAEDVELVRGLYEAWLAGDEERALAGVDPEIEWVEPPDSPDSGTHRGPGGIAFSMERWREPFDSWTMSLAEVREVSEGKVLALGRQYGRARGSEVEIEAPIFHVWTIRGGKAVRMQMFLNEAEALAAAQACRPDGDA
jgi:ketosteroid isomerase-like protein